MDVDGRACANNRHQLIDAHCMQACMHLFGCVCRLQAAVYECLRTHAAISERMQRVVNVQTGR